ncbi:TPA: hypothetical protein EYM26_14265 [Candidatus Poribacteria bacterium]|nr:hypothetical protein [Candidatus Poribacteria bacterium]
MDNLQLVLAAGKGNSTDLIVFLSPSENALFVYLGLALMERVDAAPGQFAYKMLVGRLVNAGIVLEELRRKFNHDPRTMKRWADALKSNDPDQIVRAFAGRGCLPKLIGPMIRMVKMRYFQLKGAVRNYRQVIALEVKECFGVKVSRETLRRLFAIAREEQAAVVNDEIKELEGLSAKNSTSSQDSTSEMESPALVKSAQNSCLSVDGSCLTKAVNDNQSPDLVLSESLNLAVPSKGDGDSAVAPLSRKLCLIESDGNSDSYNGLESEKKIPENTVGSSEHLRVFKPSKGLPHSGQMPSSQLRVIHHAGQILFSPWMDLIGANRPHAFGLQSQWIGQILQGAVNIEQSHLICDSSLSFFTGPTLAGLKAQRDHLAEMASPEAILDVYKANARLLPDGPGIGKAFFYDPHTKDCSTQLDMLKGWCGRHHAITKVLHLDFIHTQSGLPCFIQHYDNFYDLRERFFITLSVFQNLFPHNSLAGSTFILDRGIFGSGVFAKFREHNCDLITWEKGYRHDGWDENQPAVIFQRFRERNQVGDFKEYTFECQESSWPKDPGIRRIIARATNPAGRMIEVSILCTNPTMDIQQIVTLIFNRWVQENNFKYLDKHFGLMQITSYASENYKDIAHTLVDRLVDSPEYRELKRQYARDERMLAKLLLQRKRITNQLELLRNREQVVNQSLHEIQKSIEKLLDKLKKTNKSVKLKRLYDRLRELQSSHKKLKTQAVKFQKQLLALEEAINKTDQVLARLDADLDHTLRKKYRIDILVSRSYQRPDIRKKAMMDALRITAHNMFQNMFRLFRPIYGNYRNDHTMLRMLTRADGFIWSEDEVIQIRLWLKGRFQTHHKKAFQSFIHRLNSFSNEHFGNRAAPLNIRIIDTTSELFALTRNYGI